MTLDEMEKLARQYADSEPSDTFVAFNNARTLAHFVLAAMPLVKAAGTWVDEPADDKESEDRNLCAIVDGFTHLRAHLETGNGG